MSRTELNAKTYRGKVYKALWTIWHAYAALPVAPRVFNEGASRSGKSFDTYDFLYDICRLSPAPLNIYVFRLTLQECKEYAVADFRKKLQLREVYDDSAMTGENIRPDYRIGKSVIHFRGLDKMDKREGYDCDIVYFNELLDGVSRAQFDNLTLRCTRMVIGDWNPKYTVHWAFDMEGMPHTFFTRTTYMDNPFCPPAVRQRIESYEPTAENIANKTADEWRWKVYGQGIRAAQEGLIYPSVKWIDEYPQDLEHSVLVLDFGYTNDPTALGRASVRGNDLFFEELLYAPISDTEALYDAVSPFFTNGIYCYADSADRYVQNAEGMVNALLARGLAVIKVRKYSGSLVDGIERVKEFNLHFVKSRNLVAEVNGYVWDTVNGIAINRPIDDFNHLLDALRYGVLEELQYRRAPNL